MNSRFWSTIIIGLTIGLIASGIPSGVDAQGPPPSRNLTPDRSPAFSQRHEETINLVGALRRAAAGNWRTFSDTIVGTPIWMEYRSGVDALPGTLKANSPKGAVRVFLAQHGTIWGGPELGSTLRAYKETVDRSGGIHLFYRQFHRGVRVRGAALIFVVALDKQGRYAVRTIYGRYHPDINNLSVSPSINVEAAARALESATGADRTYSQQGERAIVLVERGYRLAWRIEMRTESDTWHGLVDAEDGTVYAIGRSLRSYTAAPAPAGISTPALRVKDLRESNRAHDVRAMCEGFDAFDARRSFGCIPDGSGYALVDATNVNAADVRIYDIPYDGGSIELYPGYLSWDGNGIWDANDQDDEVSAVVTANFVLDDFADYYGIRHFSGNPSVHLNVIASTLSDFDGGYNGNDDILFFFEGGAGPPDRHWRDSTRIWRATAASKQIFGHEFSHGVLEYAAASTTTGNVTAEAINEALADILSMHAGDIGNDPGCLQDVIIDSPASLALTDNSTDSTTVYPGCARNLIPDVHRLASWAAQEMDADHHHEYSLVLSTALFDGRAASNGAGDGGTYDKAVMHAIQDWIRPTPTFLEVRVAIIWELKYSENYNLFQHGLLPSLYTEIEFHENGIGPEALRVTDLFWEGDYWEATIEGAPGTEFLAQMQSGDDVNNDGSVCSMVPHLFGGVIFICQDRADDWATYTIPPGGELTFIPSHTGWLASRDHHPGDDHNHAVAVEVDTESSCFCDYLYYFKSDGGGDVIVPMVASMPVGENGQAERWGFAQVLGRSESTRSIAPAASLVPARESGVPSHWNPSAGITRFSVAVPSDAHTAHVRVRIYDLRGRLVRTALDRVVEPGRYTYQWDGEDNHGRHVAPGVYLAVLEAPGFRDMIKLVVTR